MSEDREVVNEETSSEELTRMLARRRPTKRARSTSILIAVLLILFGVLIGIPLGRASAPASDGPAGVSQNDGPPRGGPFGPRD